MNESEMRELLIMVKRSLGMITSWIDKWLTNHPGGKSSHFTL